MSNVVPYSRPRGALHDLAHLADLGTDRNRLLCVSDRVLYLIHNFANIDVTMRARYAEEFLESGYIPVSEGSEHFSLFMSSYEAFQLEVLDMSCDIVASLAEIRDAIQALAVNAGASGTVCCNYTFDPSSYYEDAPGSGAPSEKCLLSYAFALAWERGANEFYHQYAVGGFPSVGILAAILDEFDLPGQALLEMVSVGVANALPILESVWQGIISSLVLPVTCAIYDAPDAATAKADIYALIDNEQGATGIAADLMKGPIQNNGLNQVFDGTFPTAGVDPIDCESICFEPDTECITFPFDISAGECGSGGGICQWDGTQGDPDDGCLELIITTGINEILFEFHQWDDIVVSTGDKWTVNVKSAGPVNFNLIVRVYLEGPASDDGFVVQATADWASMHVEIPPEHDGRAVTSVQLLINKALNGNTLTGWFDTLCYVPVA